MIDLRNNIYRKQIPENENPKKVVNIVEENLNVNKQQRGNGLPLDLARVTKAFDRTQLKILTAKWILQKFAITIA